MKVELELGEIENLKIKFQFWKEKSKAIANNSKLRWEKIKRRCSLFAEKCL